MNKYKYLVTISIKLQLNYDLLLFTFISKLRMFVLLFIKIVDI